MRKFNLFGFVIIILLMFPLSTFAGTTDGFTPAEETVCDPLMEDGVTKGLYGLCVAFCEAQDWSTKMIAITPEDFDALAQEAPSGRILENYNNKRQEDDPEMPCILVREPCPCFTSQELQSIDGYSDEYGSLEYHVGNYEKNKYVSEVDPLILYQTHQLAQSYNFAADGDHVCQYVNRQTTPAIFRHLSSQSGTLTIQEWDSCFQILIDRIALD